MRKFVFHFKKAVRTGAIILVVLFPIYFVASFAMGFMKGYESGGNGSPFDFSTLSNLDGSTIIIGVAIVALLLMVVGFLFLLKLYYMLMYGKHVRNLKSFLGELERHEAEATEAKKPQSN